MSLPARRLQRMMQVLMLRQRVETFEFQENIRCHDARTGTGFDDTPTAKGSQQLRTLARNTL